MRIDQSLRCLSQQQKGSLMAPQSAENFDAGIAQPGRMASIVVILEHDKATNDAASPRKMVLPEGVRDGLLPPQMT